MEMLRSGNPALKANTFEGMVLRRDEPAMTVEGAVNKTGISLLLLIAAAALSWNRAFGSEATIPLMWLGLGGGFVVGLATAVKKDLAPLTTPIYAALEGLLLGGDVLAGGKAVSGACHQRRRIDIRRVGCAAPGVQIGTRPPEREPEARDRGGDRRHCARLPPLDGTGALR